MAVRVKLPDGREFKSMAECARAFGVSPRCVLGHLDAGTLGTIGIGVGQATSLPVWVDGILYRSQRDFSVKHGLNTSQLSRTVARMRDKGLETKVWRGWTISLKDPNPCVSSSSSAQSPSSQSSLLSSSPEITPVDADSAPQYTNPTQTGE